MDSTTLVNRVIRLRMASLGLSQRDVADSIGFTQAQLSRYLTGKYSWRLPSLDKVAVALGWSSAVDIANAAKSDFFTACEESSHEV